jgi:hypothetical protein
MTENLGSVEPPLFSGPTVLSPGDEFVTDNLDGRLLVWKVETTGLLTLLPSASRRLMAARERDGEP